MAQQTRELAEITENSKRSQQHKSCLKAKTRGWEEATMRPFSHSKTNPTHSKLDSLIWELASRVSPHTLNSRSLRVMPTIMVEDMVNLKLHLRLCSKTIENSITTSLQDKTIYWFKVPRIYCSQIITKLMLPIIIRLINLEHRRNSRVSFSRCSIENDRESLYHHFWYLNKGNIL